MKNSVTTFLLIVAATMATVSFAQNVEEKIPVYSGIHHYSAEVKLKNSDDTSLFKSLINGNEFQAFEVKDVFSSKFKDVSKSLEQINKTAKLKKEGMIIIDENGRKIYCSVLALNNGHILIEGGEVIKEIFYPNVVSFYGMEVVEDVNNPGTMVGVLRTINFKTNP